MSKIKKLSKKIKPKEEAYDSEEKNQSDHYDSMVENGTSEEDSLNDESNSSGNEDFQSDDDFSDKESDQEMKTNYLQKRKFNNKANETTKKFKTDSDSKHLYKAPTVEEINQLKETENLFHSNLFRLQIEEMLKELTIKEKYKTLMKNWLKNFNEFLNTLESQKEKEDTFKPKWLKMSKLKLPLNLENLTQQKSHFQFIKPTNEAIFVGSESLGTMIGPDLVCDVCVEMPAIIFQKGDFLNLIYEQKRALYMCYLTFKLQQTKHFKDSEMKFSYFKNNPYKPVLQIRPNEDIKKNIIFRIFVIPEISAFKLNRFVPWNSNIRDNLFVDSIELEENKENIYATPNYNSNVLFDLTMKENFKIMEKVIGENKNLQQGLILLKIWLKQRNLVEGFCGFGNFIMGMFIVLLFRQRKLQTSMSSYQVTRNVWNYLASSAWNEEGNGPTLSTEATAPNQPTLQQFHAHYDVVFIDSTGFLNICSNLSLDFYLRIKLEAARAVDLLNNYKINSFQQLFMVKLPTSTQYDHIFGIENQHIEEALRGHGEISEKHNFAGYYYPQAVRLITKVLRKGLHERILSLTPIEISTNSWACNQSPPKIKQIVRFGIVLNAEKAFDLLDKGPQANESTADEFRKFWGEKSELRRFQDGSITEACVWSTATETFTQKRLIVKKIILYLLEYHFGITNCTYLADQFDLAYQLNKLFYIFDDGENDAENSVLDVIKNFDDIGKKLRSLDDLPLNITAVQGVSPVFRYCDPVPILNQARTYKDSDKLVFQSYKICNGIIQLGVSGKWPNELLAFRRLKTAFYIQIARALSTKFNLECRASFDGVLVLNNGFIYRIELGNLKEIGLLKKAVSSKGITQYNDTPDSIVLEKNTSILPKVNSALHGLYQQYPSFGPTVMIAKRWLYAQLLDTYLWPDECTELLIASQFLKQGALVNPCQPQTGFLRFLHLLANSDWTSEMFLLNFNDEMPQEEITELENRFTNERESFPSVFIATSFDEKKYGLWWCQKSPNVQVLARATLLARHAINILEPAFECKTKINVNDLFVASLDGYDVIIKLKDNLVQTCHAYDFQPAPKSGKKIDATIPAAGFNPVERALFELREGYSDFAVFFYNPCAGKEIAVLWNPEIFNPKEFKLISVNGCEPKGENELQCNISNLVEDFKIILKDLYFSVELRNTIT